MKRIFDGKDKVGELSTQQIVLIIILLASFAIILYLLFRLNLGGESDKEICHNSVVMKGNSISSSDAFPLKCARTDVCISKDGKCEGMLNPEKVKVKTKGDVYNAMAKEMADCWWMFGEGSVDYVGSKLLERNYCSICSQILFDESLKELKEGDGSLSFPNGEINKDEFYDFLAVSEIEPGKTYADYFFGTNDIQSLKRDVLNNPDNDLDVNTFGTIKIGEQSYVMMGIRSEIKSAYKWLAVGIGTVVAVPLAIFGAPVVGAIVLGGAVATGAYGAEIAELFKPQIGGIIVEGNGIKNEFLSPTIVPARSETFEFFDCKNVLTLS